ncbi:MAG: energy-coupling factor transporter transmembrane protein EcfT [Clostridia bacterium]|nr:energy-coupling factor transporter transmembrane protein EcfT [Clostridia bacterium]
MIKNVTIGQYFPGESFVHRLDPRTKLLATIALIAVVFVSKGFAGFILIAAFVLLTALSTGVHLKFLFKGLKPIFFIIIFTFILNLFFQNTGEVLVQVWILKITTGGLRMASFMAVRLILLVISSQLLTLTTSPISLTDGLESLMRPLSKIGFPAHEIAMMMSIALRFIPTLMDEADKIMKAQKARGANFETGNILQRAKAMIPLLVPLFVGAFRRAEELALAMDARCYRGGAGRTRMNQLRYTRLDLIAALVVLALFAAVILLNRVCPF